MSDLVEKLRVVFRETILQYAEPDTRVGELANCTIDGLNRAAVNLALEEAAKVAKDAVLVPPDGGDPTEGEIAVADRAAAAIRALKEGE